MPEAFYAGSGQLKLRREGSPDITLVPGTVQNLPDDVADREDVTRLSTVCGYTESEGDVPCQRPPGWGTDEDSGRCKDCRED